MAQEVLASSSDTEEHYEFTPNLESPQTIESTVQSGNNFVRRHSSRRFTRPSEPKAPNPTIESEDESHSFHEEVFVLTDKIANLEEKVAEMSHHKNDNDVRYVKVQNENRQLLAKLDAAEEKLRDAELQAEERRKMNERRLKEALSRCKKEMQSLAESHQDKIDSLQSSLGKILEELKRSQADAERIRSDRVTLEEELAKKCQLIVPLEQQVEQLTGTKKQLQDELLANEKLVAILTLENSELRLHSQRSNSIDASTNSSQLELKSLIESLRSENRQLQETNEELQAQLLSCRINEGRNLLSPQQGNIMTACLADELITLTEEQLRRALKQEQEDNYRLKKYIDDILLNIVNNHPDLLEVGRTKVSD